MRMLLCVSVAKRRGAGNKREKAGEERRPGCIRSLKDAGMEEKKASIQAEQPARRKPWPDPLVQVRELFVTERYGIRFLGKSGDWEQWVGLLGHGGGCCQPSWRLRLADHMGCRLSLQPQGRSRVAVLGQGEMELGAVALPPSCLPRCCVTGARVESAEGETLYRIREQRTGFLGLTPRRRLERILDGEPLGTLLKRRLKIHSQALTSEEKLLLIATAVVFTKRDDERAFGELL